MSFAADKAVANSQRYWGPVKDKFVNKRYLGYKNEVLFVLFTLSNSLIFFFFLFISLKILEFQIFSFLGNLLGGSSVIKGCVRYIFARLFCMSCLKEGTCETRKNVFYFTSKGLFVLEIIKF